MNDIRNATLHDLRFHVIDGIRARLSRKNPPWGQSPPVELIILLLTEDEASERIVVPRDFLRRRSPRFRDLLDDLADKGEPAVIKISDALVETVEDFWVWTMSLKPRIEEQTQLHRVVRLGIFAWRYEIHALSNQVADVIRGSTGRGEWSLDAEIVDNIYATLPEECGLRKVIREQLQKLSPAAIMRDQVTQQRWKTTFLKHSQIGWDYMNRKENAWDTFVIRPSSCSFHDHSQHSDNSGLPVTTGSGCPYAEWECFPSGEEGLAQTKVMVKEPAQKDEQPVKGCKSKKGKKMKKKAQSNPRASEVEQMPAAEATTSPEPEFAKVLGEEAAPYEEAIPCEEATPCEEALVCEEAIVCEEATPCEEAIPCEEATPCEEALTKQPITIAEGIVSEDDCSDEWVQREDEFYGP